jgi:hypothetical protein
MGRRLKASDPTKATRHKPEPVEVRNVAHPKVWQTAIKLAGGEKDRVTVESYTRLSVVVQEG